MYQQMEGALNNRKCYTVYLSSVHTVVFEPGCAVKTEELYCTLNCELAEVVKRLMNKAVCCV